MISYQKQSLHVYMDGGTHNETGKFALVITDWPLGFFQCHGTSYGNHHYNMAYRYRLYAVLASLVVLETLFQYIHTSKQPTTIENITIHSDNTKVVKIVQ